MAQPILASVSSEPHDGKYAEIYCEIANPEDGPELFLMAITHHESHTPKGWGIGMDLERAKAFAWDLVVALERLGS